LSLLFLLLHSNAVAMLGHHHHQKHLGGERRGRGEEGMWCEGGEGKVREGVEIVFFANFFSIRTFFSTLLHANFGRQNSHSQRTEDALESAP